MSSWVLPPFCVSRPDSETDFFLRGGGAVWKIPFRFFGFLPCVLSWFLCLLFVLMGASRYTLSDLGAFRGAFRPYLYTFLSMNLEHFKT